MIALHIIGQGPVEARCPLCCRIARYTGVDDGDILAGFFQRGLQHIRHGMAGIEPQARGQAVAQSENGGGGGGRCEAKAEQKKKHAKAAHDPYISPASAGNKTLIPALKFENVSLTLTSHAGPVDILKGVSFEAKTGEAIGVIGPSGSGKTSLLMVASGLESATSGRVQAAGLDLTGKSESALAQFRRDTIGIIFQSFHLIPTMTALENVAVPLEFKGATDAFARAEDSLKRVGLSHRLTHYPSQLSGGEQQRVAIARAVAAGAKILLADEPTGNLDQETGATIIDLLFELQTKEGATLLLVTHDRNLAKRCSRILEVRDGMVKEGHL